MRLRSVVAFGIGYLLGTRAGRDRYKELVQTGQDLTQTLREVTTSSTVAQDLRDKVRSALGLPPQADGGEPEGGEPSAEDRPHVEVVAEPERERHEGG